MAHVGQELGLGPIGGLGGGLGLGLLLFIELTLRALADDAQEAHRAPLSISFERHGLLKESQAAPDCPFKFKCLYRLTRRIYLVEDVSHFNPLGGGAKGLVTRP